MNIDSLLKDNDFVHFVEKNDPDEFTFYDVIDMAFYEIRHSNTLAWLFDAKSRHNLKYQFLIKFIESLYNYKNNHEKLKSIIRIDENGIFLNKTNKYINFENIKFEVKREWRYIDILIVSEENKFVITIENKPGMEDPGQLASYKNSVIDVEYKEQDYTRIFIFLTVDGTPPEKDEDKKFWLPYDYKEVVKIIDNFLLSDKTIKIIDNSRIIDFIRQYVYNLKKNLINYYDLTNEASILYNKHLEIFKFLNYKKDSNNLQQTLKEYSLTEKVLNSINYIILSQSNLQFKILKYFTDIIKNKKFEIVHHPRENQKWLCFITPELKEIIDKKGYKGPDRYFFIAIEPKNISLEFYSDAEFATDVFKKIDSFDFFTVHRKDYYSNRIYQKDVLTDQDYYNKSYEELIKLYEGTLGKFLEEDVKFICEELNKLV